MDIDYLAYWETFRVYFPYLFYSFVFLTLIPKSLRRIKTFADADYEANRHKYHRCYAPDICCHTFGEAAPKPKPRKAVTRVYPKRHSTAGTTEAYYAKQDVAPTTNAGNHIKRQVEPASIQTNTHVNQIAKMFENVPTVTVSPALLGKKINRVTPTIQSPDEEETTHASAPKSTFSASRLSQLLTQEQLESSLSLLQETNTDEEQNCWRDSPPRRTHRRAEPPTSLHYNGAGTSTTPSTISPAASSPPSDSPPLSASPLNASSPVLFRPQLSMKSSLEDIFAAIARNAEKSENFIYAGCQSLSPVTSIDDILSQRRLSRPLSAYSISDLLSEESSAMDEARVENFLTVLNKT
ncbi:uncharacterized protein LOC105220755 [Zeugodacus cucurbitae]|uniref:uncharacterized protein LOC105220755 n=1 Tax=Zeugodacus cucurbitae TaxID=28588 RepID=UPI0023D8EFD1|nr:uncharacterized protein LOC105220755 [Zeugodacus cucurbitae]XP_054084582.1 uncharacterized protein LOC105220755 [Zeugodacus cucurbitae]XP_054084584.1 uncharacterized protein LOC105220755 [Zeugodacus cucurbitae]XP_054084585.1 uncharacterized protein LOC105220755 [Zeugodacus cucurbitae]